MADLYDRFISRDNFYFAFKKLKYIILQGNEWYNPVELSAYEATLSDRLPKIIDSIEQGTYLPQRIQPIPFPKKNDENGKTQIRSYFRIALDDQMVWIAIINVLGDKIEPQMPFWSYGNRLYRPTWVEYNRVRKGPINNTSKHFFRPWRQGWPQYRKDIFLTTQTMSAQKNKEPQNAELEDNNIDLENLKKTYLSPAYWQNNHPLDKLYWMGLDFKTFFPLISHDCILNGIKEALKDRNDVGKIVDLISKLLNSEVDTQGWNKEELTELGIIFSGTNARFNGIPTGLVVSGVLANIAMIEFDKLITNWISKHRTIAVFKYVDDHIILAKTTEDLKHFFDYFKEELSSTACNINIQNNKLLPSTAFTNGDFNENIIATQIDVEFPDPLMTTTLEKVSMLNDDDYELSSEKELAEIQVDLEQFLITNFPDSEMRKDTRVSFAATKLSQLAKFIKIDFRKLDFSLAENILRANNEVIKRKRKNVNIVVEDEFENVKKEFIDEAISKEIDSYHQKIKRIAFLLLKAIKENPEKIKLWKRAIQFSFNTGYDHLPNLLQEIDKVPIHDSSRIYLRNYCMLCIHLEIAKSTTVILQEAPSFWDLYRAWMSLKTTLNLTLEDQISTGNNFPFQAETYSIYSITNRLITCIIKKTPSALVDAVYLQKEKLTNIINRNEFNHLLMQMDEETIWYILSSLPEKERKKYWYRFIMHLKLDNAISWSILTLYPSQIPFKVFQDLMQYNHSDEKRKPYSEERTLIKTDAFLLDIFSNNEEIKAKYLSEFDTVRAIINRKNVDFISLKSWVQELIKQNNSDPDNKQWIDPRQSEWTCIEIIVQIIDSIIDQKKHTTEWIFLDERMVKRIPKIHPVNYLIPKEWLKKDKAENWRKWKDLIRKHKLILAPDDELIHDFRYIAISKMWKKENVFYLFGYGELSSALGLCVLLTQLLAKDFSWPSTNNKLTFIEAVFAQAAKTIEYEAVSSETRILLNSIFTQTDVDFFYGSKSIDLKNGQSINNLSDLKKQLKSIQKLLVQTHISGDGRQPRQLTTINIPALLKLNN